MTIALVWFRQDLRLSENPAFLTACAEHKFVIPLYIYTGKSVLGQAQAWWLHHSLIGLNQKLQDHGLSLILRKGDPLDIIVHLIKQANIDAVYWNRCYEPYAIARDKKIKSVLNAANIQTQSFNGSVFHEPWTIMNKQGTYFKVFTPYWKECRTRLVLPKHLRLTRVPEPIQIKSDHLNSWHLLPKINWDAQFSAYWTPGEVGAQKHLKKFIKTHLYGYKKNRDFPAQRATSYLSPHLHFGEISPWTILRAVEIAKLEHTCDEASAEHFLSELGWREFSIYLLYHFPKLPKQNFKAEFDNFPWHKNPEGLARWQTGMTGYPIVDAGMRELWTTGYMHNRVRMIVASFLVKDLLIDWRKGADWFLDTLVDADLANNSAAWQWVAGSGADAAPYFRIFNPVLQSQKFDPDGTYIRQWVPELAALDNRAIHEPWSSSAASIIATENGYPKPIIDHQKARSKALQYYKRLKTSRD